MNNLRTGSFSGPLLFYMYIQLKKKGCLIRIGNLPVCVKQLC